MKGVEFFFDRDGEPKAVLINLKTHGELWEDFHDLMTARERRNEPTVPLEVVVKRLKERKRLSRAK